MTDKQLPDWAIAKAFRQCQVFAAPSKTREFILLVEHRARELSAQKRPQRVRHSCEVDMLSECPGCEAEAQQPDAARGEQPAWYGACHGVAAPYDHTKPPPGVAPDHHGKAGQRLQPARDGALLDEIGRKAWTYAVYMSDVCAIFETQPPQPADGEAVSHDSDCAVHNEPAMPAGDCDCSKSAAGKVLSGWNGDEMHGSTASLSLEHWSTSTRKNCRGSR